MYFSNAIKNLYFRSKNTHNSNAVGMQEQHIWEILFFIVQAFCFHLSVICANVVNTKHFKILFFFYKIQLFSPPLVKMNHA